MKLCLGFCLLLFLGSACCPAQARPSHGLDQALFNAIARADAPAVRHLLARGANPNARIGRHTAKSVPYCVGHTPLMAAAEHGSAAIARLLLDHGANPNAVEECSMYTKMITNTTGRTALMIAAQNGRIDVAQLLLARGAKVNAAAQIVMPTQLDTPPASVTALSFARAYHRKTMETLLLRGGAVQTSGLPTPGTLP